jgi:hypothetical protein
METEKNTFLLTTSVKKSKKTKMKRTISIVSFITCLLIGSGIVFYYSQNNYTEAKTSTDLVILNTTSVSKDSISEKVSIAICVAAATASITGTAKCIQKLTYTKDQLEKVSEANDEIKRIMANINQAIDELQNTNDRPTKELLIHLRTDIGRVKQLNLPVVTNTATILYDALNSLIVTLDTLQISVENIITSLKALNGVLATLSDTITPLSAGYKTVWSNFNSGLKTAGMCTSITLVTSGLGCFNAIYPVVKRDINTEFHALKSMETFLKSANAVSDVINSNDIVPRINDFVKNGKNAMALVTNAKTSLKPIVDMFSAIVVTLTPINNLINDAMNAPIVPKVGYIPNKKSCPIGLRDDGTSCWLDTYSIGVGTLPANCNGKDLYGGFCYNHDSAVGQFCLTRTAVCSMAIHCNWNLFQWDGAPWTDCGKFGANPTLPACDSGYILDSGLCYQTCKKGFSRVGCCLCQPDEGAGIKLTLFQRQYCNNDDTLDTGLCYGPGSRFFTLSEIINGLTGLIDSIIGPIMNLLNPIFDQFMNLAMEPLKKIINSIIPTFTLPTIALPKLPSINAMAFDTSICTNLGDTFKYIVGGYLSKAPAADGDSIKAAMAILCPGLIFSAIDPTVLRPTCTGSNPSSYVISGNTMIKSATLSECGALRSGNYMAAMQSDGNFVIYNIAYNRAVGSTGTMGRGIAPRRLVFQNDGNVVVYDKNNLALWATSTFKPNESVFTMQDDGNLVLYDTSRNPIWFSDTWGK